MKAVERLVGMVEDLDKLPHTCPGALRAKARRLRRIRDDQLRDATAPINDGNGIVRPASSELTQAAKYLDFFADAAELVEALDGVEV